MATVSLQCGVVPIYMGSRWKKFAELRRQKGFSEEMKEIYCSVRDSAYEIIKRKGATYYGIGMAAAKIAEALVRDSHTVAPVSVHLNGEYGLQDLCLSIPTVLGKKWCRADIRNQF